jgi:hypothetical protein
MIPDNKSGPPLGGAPGYGGPSEGVVGNQGGDQTEGGKPAAEPTEKQPAAKPTGKQPEGEESSEASKGEPVLLKEELAPEEKGTSLDEGGAG